MKYIPHLAFKLLKLKKQIMTAKVTEGDILGRSPINHYIQ